MSTLTKVPSYNSPNSAERSAKQLKRDLVQLGRKGVKHVNQLTTIKGTSSRKLLPRHESFKDSVIGLWLLGYWPDQIADFIGGVEEAIVMATLRRYFSQHYDDLVREIMKQNPILES